MPSANRLLSALLLSALATAPARAAEYWVDPVRGDDANPGTLAQPKRTLDRAFRAATDGDTVRALPGVYGSVASGEAAFLVVFGNVRFIGSGIGRTVLENLDTLTCYGCPEMTGVTFRDTTTRSLPLRFEVTMLGEFFPTPVESRVHGCEFDGVSLRCDPPTQSLIEHRVLIDRNAFHDLLGPAVQVESRKIPDGYGPGAKEVHLTVRNNLVIRAESLFRHDVPGTIASPGEAWTAYPTIVNNTSVDLTGDAVHADSSNWPYAVVRNMVVSNNFFVNVAGYGIDEPALDTTPLEIANNYFTGTTLGVYKDPTLGVLATVADLNASLPQASANVDAAPVFVDATADDYRLAAGSPGIDAALDTSAPPDDFDGDPRPLDGDGDMLAVADVGADEYRDGPSLLRNADATDLAPLTPPRATLFPLRSPRDDFPGLLPPAGLDDLGVLADPAMKLVLYQLVRPGNDLFVVKRTGELHLEY